MSKMKQSWMNMGGKVKERKVEEECFIISLMSEDSVSVS